MTNIPQRTVLDDIHQMLTKYVAFPTEHASAACALWIAHVWVVSSFFTTPRLVIQSPEPGSGKTRLLEVLAILCRDSRLTMSTSAAALYRRIGGSAVPPTVLADEADAVFSKNATSEAEAQRAIFNSGYRRGAVVDRCEGDGAKMKVVSFRVFCPVALAGLGTLPRTITTRAVVVEMRKRAPSEVVAAFRERDAVTEAAPIIEALEIWAELEVPALAEARPDMPPGVVDRPAEVWEPLIAVADSIGGSWPALAREACKYFVFKPNDEAASIGVRLLADIEALFNPVDSDGTPLQPATEMHSADIVKDLTSAADSPWRDLWGKPLDQRRLAAELKKYGVRAKQVRVGGLSAKGYLTEPHLASDGNSVGLTDAWHRYLPPDRGNIRNKGNNAAQRVSDNRPVSDVSETPVVTETDLNPVTCTVSDVSDVSPLGDRAPPTATVSPPQRHLTAIPDVASDHAPATPRPLCTACGRAPARPDSDACDFCTAKRERFRIS